MIAPLLIIAGIVGVALLALGAYALLKNAFADAADCFSNDALKNGVQTCPFAPGKMPSLADGADIVKNSKRYKDCPDSVKNEIKSKDFTAKERKMMEEVLTFYKPLMTCPNQPLKKIGRTDKGITKGASGCVAETDTMGEAFSDKDAVVLTDAASNPVDFPDKDKQFKGTATHEFGHALLNDFDPRTCTAYDDWRKNPLMQEYMKEAGWDPTGTTLTETPPDKAISDYAKKSPREDLSEAMMYYYTDPEKLKKESPKRYAFIDKLMKEQAAKK